jgi:hypothetical protein
VTSLTRTLVGQCPAARPTTGTVTCLTDQGLTQGVHGRDPAMLRATLIGHDPRRLNVARPPLTASTRSASVKQTPNWPEWYADDMVAEQSRRRPSEEDE